MVLYSPDWTNIGFSFILLTVILFRHPTLIEHGLYCKLLRGFYFHETAGAKFRDNITLSFTYVGKSCPSRKL